MSYPYDNVGPKHDDPELCKAARVSLNPSGMLYCQKSVNYIHCEYSNLDYNTGYCKGHGLNGGWAKCEKCKKEYCAKCTEDTKKPGVVFRFAKTNICCECRSMV
jgi:hypothetical protein